MNFAASVFNVFVVSLMILDSSALALASCPSMLSISVEPDFPSGCNFNYSTCSDLQRALEVVANKTRGSEGDCVEVSVPRGQHYITSQLFFGIEEVHIVGAGSTSTFLVCDYQPESNLDYTWYFNWTQSVVLQDISLLNCLRPLRLDTLSNLEVSNCSFKNFSEAVLDIYNCQNVSLSESIFQNNQGTGILQIPYRGNTGAVAVGFNDVPPDFPPPCIRIQGSQFINNSATAASIFETSNQAFTNQYFTGRGGGLGIFINESFHNLTVRIDGCKFEGNFARSFGGGVYMLFNGEGTQHFIFVEKSELVFNTALKGGGGIQLSYISNGIQATPHTAIFTECFFTGNRGEAGGGIYIYPSFRGGAGNLAIMKQCVFVGNGGVGTRNDYGAAVAVSLLSLFTQRDFLVRHEVIDCSFLNNTGENGIFSIGYAPMVFKGSNHFIHNQGTALRIVGSIVEVFGELNFVENVATDGSALYLISFGQILLRSGLRMKFIRNKGRFGSSIQVESQATSLTFQRLAFNPQCFALYEEPTVPPMEWNNVSIEFDSNQAVLASALYISSLDTCSFTKLKPPFFNQSSILDWPIWKFGNDSNTGYSDPTNKDYQVETFASIISTSPKTVEEWPGYRFAVYLDGIDQLGHKTAITARFLPKPNRTSTVVKLQPELVVAGSSDDNSFVNKFTLTYAVSSASDLLLQNQDIADVAVELPFQSASYLADNISLRPLPCPGGYSLESLNGLMGCTCKDVPEILNCEDDQETILIKTGYWAVRTRSVSAVTLKFHTCPPGYCRCFQSTSVGNTTCVYMYNNSDPRQQCACSRKGVLCGACRDNQGVSALLDHCISCSNVSALLILALIMADVFVFITLLNLDIPLPAWIYPFVFYFQLAPHSGVFYVNTFDTVGKYLYFIGSALSFYLVYDFCLYDGISAEVSYFLRYLPFITAVAVTILVVIFRRIRVMKPLRAHGVWWIIVFLYSQVVHTSMSILNCPSIQGSDQSIAAHWFVNGEIECFTGGHAPLALLAIFMLVLCVSMIPLAVIISLGLIQRFRIIRKLSISLTESFREGCRWWSAVEVGRRFLLLLIIIPFPSIAVAPVLVLCLSIAVYGFVQPYKSQAANILEVVVQINFLLLLLVKITYNGSVDFDTLPPVTEDFLNSTAINVCNDKLTGVVAEVWTLLPFYYFPLLLIPIVALIWLGIYIRRRVAERKAALYRVNTVSVPTKTVVTTQELMVEAEDGHDTGYIILTSTNSEPQDWPLDSSKL